MIIFNHHVYRGPWQHNKHNQTFPLQNCIRGLALPESRAGKCRASWHQGAPVTSKGGKLPELCQSKAHTHTHIRSHSHMQTPNYTPIPVEVVFKPFSTQRCSSRRGFLVNCWVAAFPQVRATKQLSMVDANGQKRVKGTWKISDMDPPFYPDISGLNLF